MSLAFERGWTAEILRVAPLIAPARQYVWPLRVAGEEDAMARGALQLMVRPATGGAYLVTCALGFADPAMPTGIFSCPNPEEVCAVAGGYAYVAKADAPERVTQVELKPVVAIQVALHAELLLFVGFHTIVAWGKEGHAWKTGRLSWEGIRITELGDREVRGFGWDLQSDQEMSFTVDLKTGRHVGGGYQAKG